MGTIEDYQHVRDYLQKGVMSFKDRNMRGAEFYLEKVYLEIERFDSSSAKKYQMLLQIVRLFDRMDTKASAAMEFARLAMVEADALALNHHEEGERARRAAEASDRSATAAEKHALNTYHDVVKILDYAVQYDHTSHVEEVQEFVEAVNQRCEKVTAAREETKRTWQEVRDAQQDVEDSEKKKKVAKIVNQNFKNGVDAFRRKNYNKSIECFQWIVNQGAKVEPGLEARARCFVETVGLTRKSSNTVAKAQTVVNDASRLASDYWSPDDRDHQESAQLAVNAARKLTLNVQHAAKRTREKAEVVLNRTGNIDEGLVKEVEKKYRNTTIAFDAVNGECLKVEEARQHASDRAAKRRDKALAAIDELFTTDFLSADDRFAGSPHRQYLTDYRSRKIEFVQSWADQTLRVALDQEQAAAVAAVKGNVQVTARAGSGKTRTLVTRAAFLLMHCDVPPSSLLLVAFNKKAAKEIKNRLEKWIPEGALPHVMTFHALAHALVKPQEELLFDDSRSGALHLNWKLQEIVNDYRRQSYWHKLIMKCLLSLFYGGLDEDSSPGYLSRMLKERCEGQRETLRGERVKSLGEQIIANTLFEYDVGYKYEKHTIRKRKLCRFDFIIEGSRDLVIEYFSSHSGGNYDRISKARKLWSQKLGGTFLEYSDDDIKSYGVDGFVNRLLGDLRGAGVKTRRLSEEEILRAILERNAVEEFAKTIASFVDRCRAKNLDSGKVKEMVKAHSPRSMAEHLFLKTATAIYDAYLQKLKTESKEDFSGLMSRAAKLIRAERTIFVRDRGRETGDVAQLRFIMIDEFQDYAPLFHELVEAIREVNDDACVFAVGDDWQAINRFAGSQLDYFENFDAYFGSDVHKFEIVTNFRSTISVVEAGNALMVGRGTPGRSSSNVRGAVQVAQLEEFQVSPLERLCNDGSFYMSAVIRLIRHLIKKSEGGAGFRSVVVLSRTGKEPYRHRDLDRFLWQVQKFLSEDERHCVSVSTVHSYKGREEEGVLILDGLLRRFPLIHPKWEFFRVLGDGEEMIKAEERRLFYVALTRAKHEVVILSETGVASPYLEDVSPMPLSWTNCPICPDFIEVRVYGGYGDQALLKQENYTWNKYEKYWHRAYRKEKFPLNEIKAKIRGKSIRKIMAYYGNGQPL